MVVVKKDHTAKFGDSNGQQGELLNFSVADKSPPMLATLSDKTKHSKIVEGKTLPVKKQGRSPCRPKPPSWENLA